MNVSGIPNKNGMASLTTIKDADGRSVRSAYPIDRKARQSVGNIIGAERRIRYMTVFENPIYADLERRVHAFMDGGQGDIDALLKEIRGATLYGNIESYEEIRLMDLLNPMQNDSIDEGWSALPDETNGGIQCSFDEEEEHDMSYLDDYPEEEEEQESGFLGFLG